MVIFEDYQIRKIEKNGQVWISAIDVAKSLEYENPAQAVNTVLKRNKDRFENYSIVDKLSTKVQSYSATFLNLKGVIAFCMLSNMPKAVDSAKSIKEITQKNILIDK